MPLDSQCESQEGFVQQGRREAVPHEGQARATDRGADDEPAVEDRHVRRERRVETDMAAEGIVLGRVEGRVGRADAVRARDGRGSHHTLRFLETRKAEITATMLQLGCRTSAGLLHLRHLTLS